MKTYEITREQLGNAEPLCYGYKAVKYDGGTQQSFKYGNTGDDLVGKIFTCDGDISICKWGLHFCKDPAYVFNFYEPLGYNRYFKVAVYNKFEDGDDGLKSVAQTIEFVEEYDMMQYIDIIKRYDRGSNAVRCSNAVSYSNAVSDSTAVNGSNAVSYSNAVSDSTAVNGSNAVSYSNAVRCSNAVSYSTAVNGSNAVRCSNAVSYSNAVSDSTAVNGSNAVSDSTAVNGSKAVSDSTAVNGSNAVSGSYGLRSCDAIKYGLFCYKKEAAKYVLFNKKVKKERFDEVFAKIRSFDWTPKFDNFYDLKGDKEWWALCFPELMKVDNKTAWSKIPADMLEYIKSLPEYDETIFNKITGD